MSYQIKMFKMMKIEWYNYGRKFIKYFGNKYMDAKLYELINLFFVGLKFRKIQEIRKMFF